MGRNRSTRKSRSREEEQRGGAAEDEEQHQVAQLIAPKIKPPNLL